MFGKRRSEVEIRARGQREIAPGLPYPDSSALIRRSIVLILLSPVRGENELRPSLRIVMSQCGSPMQGVVQDVCLHETVVSLSNSREH